MMRTLSLVSPDCSFKAEVSAAGGILSSLRKLLNPDSSTELLYIAPWLNETSQDTDMPPLMQRLAGEWVGVPFGCVSQDDALFLSHAPHGLPVNGEWDFITSTLHDVVMRYNYPEAYPLSHLERRIALTNDGVDFALTVFARRECCFPLGLHPIFPLGEAAGEVEIVASGGGLVYPQAVEPGISRLMPGARFTRLHAVPMKEGVDLDISHLPLPYNSEEIVQLLEPHGCVTLRYPQRRLQLTLSWDDHLLPHCLLWISNAGRRHPPWNGRNYCLGVEPVCSAWDLGPTSMTDNPISLHHAPTAMSLTAHEKLTLTYQIRCTEII